MSKIEVILGDITKQKVDVIVNAANTGLRGGGGVDGAIHRAAGPAMLDECQQLGGCPTGDAKITKGYNLPARYVIHAVGPVWQGGRKDEPELLAHCYSHSLNLAVSHKCRSIAFPCISTGVYRFPKQRAAQIACETVKQFLESDTTIEQVVFVCFSQDDFDIYQSFLD